MVLTQRGAVSPRGGTRQAKGRRVLIVCPEAPSPPTWGFALRVHHLALQLAKHNSVSMLTYGTPDDGRDWDGLQRMLDQVHRVPPPAARHARRRQQLASLGGRTSFHLGALRSEAMQRELDTLIANGGFDIVQVESSQLMCLEFHGTTPVVLDEHNIEYQLLGRVAGIESSAVRRLFGRVEAAKVEREERRAWSVADGCVATSAVDEAVIRAARPEMPTAVVPNAVDTDYFHPRATSADPEGMVFVASLSYRPNTDAVVWFTDQVLPRVRRARPGAVLTVVGKGTPAWLRRLEGPGVVVTGAVDDVRPHLERASVVVAPLRVGSGTRLKVLEGLSTAKPVVSTTLGAEGLDVTDGEHLLLADDPAEMADAILRVMADEALAARLGAAGRALVLERYGWAGAAARLEAFHAQVAGIQVGGAAWR